uniref:Uncharacterized protein n=1 Tax=Octopus bimaculoides TaxID=37653 RepID=A0A0L8I1L3_OCTBM
MVVGGGKQDKVSPGHSANIHPYLPFSPHFQVIGRAWLGTLQPKIAATVTVTISITITVTAAAIAAAAAAAAAATPILSDCQYALMRNVHTCLIYHEICV